MEKTDIYLCSCFFWLLSLDLFYIVLDVYFLVPCLSVNQIWIASAGIVETHMLQIY